MVFAGGAIGTKIGSGAASALMTSFLNNAGYVATTKGFAIQPDAAIYMIKSIYFIGPLIIAFIVFVVLALYRLDKQYDKIMLQLAEREARGEL